MNEPSTRPSLRKLLIANAIMWVTCFLVVHVTPHFVSSPEKARFPITMAMLFAFLTSSRIIRLARGD